MARFLATLTSPPEATNTTQMSIPRLPERTEDMEAAGQTVSKRSVRAQTEEGAEQRCPRRQSKRNSRCEEQLQSEAMERRGSSSSSKSACGSDLFSSTSSSTATAAAAATTTTTATAPSSSERMSLESWADPTEPQSWNEDGKLLPHDPIRNSYHVSKEGGGGGGDALLETGLYKTSLPLTGRPTNFGVIVPGVYRCGYPQPEDYAFVQGLQLKTVVTLVKKELPKGYASFLRANGIRHHVFDMKGTKKEDIPVRTMRAILRLVLDRQNHPMLIHCNHGKHRTGCVVGVVRKVTGWELPPILDEYRSFAAPKERECDIDYITAFEPADISAMFAAAPPRHQHRTRGRGLSPSLATMQTWAFARAALFALFVLALWLTSTSSLAWHRRSHFVDFR